MSISPFFLELRASYQAELDDLTSDSEGKDVLKRRLTEKRKELGFLLQMMELSPEMVAVVLHQAFRFTRPAAMDHVLAQDADALPEWESLSADIEIAAWARDVVKTILQEPMGAWFMTIACALEYMHHKPLTAAERAQLASANQEEEEDQDEVRNERRQRLDG
jgi:acyl-CoA hydrolase